MIEIPCFLGYQCTTRLLDAQIQATADMDSHLVLIFLEIAACVRARFPLYREVLEQH